MDPLSLLILASQEISHVGIFSIDAPQVTISFSLLDSLCYIYFVYGWISHVERRILWNFLLDLSLGISTIWFVLGDFNAVLGPMRELILEFLVRTSVWPLIMLIYLC